ncbi:MAG: hypothetical protein JWN86_505 [Planctomycetota bacterium]|nr:hypothetical protein [Planctomycetota bacterium]
MSRKDAARGLTLMDGASRTIRYLAIGTLALSAAAVGCKSPVGTTAASMLRKVEESPDPNIRYQAYAKLASSRAYDNDQQKAEAAKILSSRLASAKEPIASRAEICHTLGELQRPEGREVLLRTAKDTEPVVRAAACRALGKAGLAEDWTLLARVMTTDADRDCQVAAIEALAQLKSIDPRLTITLVDGMEHSDPAIRLASLDAIRAVTGQDLGSDPGPWKKFAEDQARTGSGTVRR